VQSAFLALAPPFEAFVHQSIFQKMQQHASRDDGRHAAGKIFLLLHFFCLLRLQVYCLLAEIPLGINGLEQPSW
jgi:hypothetical protein